MANKNLTSEFVGQQELSPGDSPTNYLPPYIPHATLMIDVKDKHGLPIVNAKVVCPKEYLIHGDEDWISYTDSDGNCNFGDVGLDHRYLFNITAEGYTPITMIKDIGNNYWGHYYLHVGMLLIGEEPTQDWTYSLGKGWVDFITWIEENWIMFVVAIIVIIVLIIIAIAMGVK